MKPTLPPVGTHRLLDCVSDYVPDEFIANVCARDYTGGRRHALSSPQLWRVHLLALLTSTHSLNLVVAQLSEQPAWRHFARLRRIHPSVRMLHEFRQQVGVSGLRQINRHLLERLLRRQGLQPRAVALMDSTDLPAACSGFKKKFRPLHGPACRAGGTHPQDRPKPLVCRLQEAHVAAVAAHRSPCGDTGTAGLLGHSGKRGRWRFAAPELAVVSASLGLVAWHRGGGYGLFVRPQQATGAAKAGRRPW